MHPPFRFFDTISLFCGLAPPRPPGRPLARTRRDPYPPWPRTGGRSRAFAPGERGARRRRPPSSERQTHARGFFPLTRTICTTISLAAICIEGQHCVRSFRLLCRAPPHQAPRRRRSKPTRVCLATKTRTRAIQSLSETRRTQTPTRIPRHPRHPRSIATTTELSSVPARAAAGRESPHRPCSTQQQPLRPPPPR